MNERIFGFRLAARFLRRHLREHAKAQRDAELNKVYAIE